jgi:hypothetical protein
VALLKAELTLQPGRGKSKLSSNNYTARSLSSGLLACSYPYIAVVALARAGRNCHPVLCKANQDSKESLLIPLLGRPEPTLRPFRWNAALVEKEVPVEQGGHRPVKNFSFPGIAA